MTKFKITRLEEKVGDKTISIETGLIAKQADASVTIQMGDTVLLSTVTCSKEQRPGPASFVPITVNYKERTYAAGKIPGGFFKREGRPTTKEILSSRLTDRSIRPLFPENFNMETQVSSMVLSSDQENDADILSIIASSAAITISCIPMGGPVAAVRVGMVDGEFIINPTFEQREKSELDLVISGTLKGILMVEGGANIVPDQTIAKVMEFAKPEINKLCNLQLKLRELVGVPKLEIPKEEFPKEIETAAEEIARPKIVEILNSFVDKHTREQNVKEIKKSLNEKFIEQYPDCEPIVSVLVEDILYEESRKLVLTKKIRVDGRKSDQIRDLDIRVGVLPRTHGSALFTRGQTQALVACTLGTPDDKQLVETLEGSHKDRFMLHYNFPGFATGECKPDRGPGRREIGHGELAKRSILPLIPSEENFAYTIRLVSDIMESNGSSSMASVCGASLSLFDAGVNMKAACAGIAMGLITDNKDYMVLSDILGMEDHLGDMDFKLAGTREGVTAFQMDVKLQEGIPLEILKEAITQAGAGRNFILDNMEKVIKTPRETLSIYAPRMLRLTIPQDKIGALIGPGGKNIRKIIEETGAEIEVQDEGDSGIVFISSTDVKNVESAKTMVEYYTAEVEVGKVYTGKVVSIQNFGAFVEVLPGKEGLLHISEIAPHRIEKVEDELKRGQEIEVKVVEMDNIGKFRLSRKVLLQSDKTDQKDKKKNK
jgi:polyribonucleotide nucleotidyltransferase